MMRIYMTIFLTSLTLIHSKGIHIHNEDLLCELVAQLYSKEYEKKDIYERYYHENRPIFLVKTLKNTDDEKNCS